MTDAALYAIGTLLSWAGLVLVIRGVFGLVSRGVGSLQAGALLSLGGLGLVVGSMLLPHDGLRVPLVWPVMPFVAWGVVVSFLFAASRGLKALLEIEPEARRGFLLSGAIALALAVVFFVLFRMTPDTEVKLLKGGIPLSIGSAVGLIALAVAAAVGMAFTSRSLKARDRVRAFATHAALIVGSIIFGFPFFWLVLTSFKEERDMASPEGLVWIPKVQVKVPYHDPKKPLYETRFQGDRVEGYVIERKGDAVKIDVQKPMGMRGLTFDTVAANLKEIPTQIDVVQGDLKGQHFQGQVIEQMEDGRERVEITSPDSLKGRVEVFTPTQVEPVRKVGLRYENYSDALDFLPPEAQRGLVYLKNTLILVIMNVIGTILASSLVAYAFSRLRFPGRGALFSVLLSTMMLPSAITLLPQFLIFRSLGWVDTLLPLWVPAFFGSAFNIFLLRQFFLSIPMELEDAAKIDGCGYLKSFWSVMLPQIKPALAVIAIWTFLGAWNNFMGPLIYVNSPEHMPISYAVQMYNSDRSGEPGLLMAFATMAIVPVLAVFFFAQRYFIEGVTLSGLGGR